MYSNFKHKISQYNDSAVQYLSEFICLYHKAGDSMKVRPFNKNVDNNLQPEWWDNDRQLLKSKKVKT